MPIWEHSRTFRKVKGQKVAGKCWIVCFDAELCPYHSRTFRKVKGQKVTGNAGLFVSTLNYVLLILEHNQVAVTYRFPSDHRSQAPSSGVSTWMGDQPGTPRAAGNIWCTRHMAKPRPQVGRVCQSHHQNTPQFTIKCDWSLDLSKKKKKKIIRSKVKKWWENADR